jgi:serine/threonine protein phosphatase PrpC
VTSPNPISSTSCVGRPTGPIKRSHGTSISIQRLQGTTLTAMLFAGDRLGLAHVGDSRAYVLRDGSLSQMTKDETFVQSLIDQGELTSQEALSHPHRSVVLRALDGHKLKPSQEVHEVRVGDHYMICSDGVSDVLALDTLAEALQAEDPLDCAYPLLQLAMCAGTQDNVTCAVARITDRDFGYHTPLMFGAVSESLV